VQVGIGSLPNDYCRATFMFKLMPGDIDLGTYTAAFDGSLNASLTLPSDLAPGEYTLMLLTDSAIGKDVELNSVKITVASGSGSAVPRSATDVPAPDQPWSPGLAVLAGALVLASTAAGLAVRRRSASR
jgi:hypothetical protein